MRRYNAAMNSRTLLVLAMMATAAPAVAAPRALPATAPYLQNGRVGAMTLVWREASQAPATVTWWEQDGGEPRQARSHAAFQHEVALTGLRPGGRYRWQVRQGSAVWHGSFLANRGPEMDHARFAVVGDLGSGTPEQSAVVRDLQAFAPEFIVAPGDIVYSHGGWDEFGPRFFGPYAPLLGHVPFYPVLGNHDVRTEDGAPYLAAFALPAEPGGERWYAFSHGPAQFFCLDSNRSVSPGSPQHAWLAQAGAASTARWKIAVLHHPPYSTGLHGPHGPLRRDLTPLLGRLGFDLVLSGHDHHYERFYPQGGVTYVVTGGGGGLLYRASGGPATAALANAHHFVGITIAGDTLALRAIGERGRVLDAHAIRKASPAR